MWYWRGVVQRMKQFCISNNTMSYLAGAILYKALNGGSFSLVLCCFAMSRNPVRLWTAATLSQSSRRKTWCKKRKLCMNDAKEFHPVLSHHVGLLSSPAGTDWMSLTAVPQGRMRCGRPTNDDHLSFLAEAYSPLLQYSPIILQCMACREKVARGSET